MATNPSTGSRPSTGATCTCLDSSVRGFDITEQRKIFDEILALARRLFPSGGGSSQPDLRIEADSRTSHNTDRVTMFRRMIIDVANDETLVEGDWSNRPTAAVNSLHNVCKALSRGRPGAYMGRVPARATDLLEFADKCSGCGLERPKEKSVMMAKLLSE